MRLRLFIAMAAFLVATADVTVLVNRHLNPVEPAKGGSQVVGDGTVTTTTTTSTAPAQAPPTTASGTLTALHAEGARLDPYAVRTPLTIEADRGFGNGVDVTGVEVDGTTSAIVWDGGRPFVLSSGGALVLGSVSADVEGDGLRVGLSTSEHHFAPGTYQLDTPVAVGASGVATALDAVTFHAGANARLRASGNASVLLPSAAYHLVVGGTVHLAGTLSVTDATGTRTVTGIDSSDGVTDLTLTPAAGGGWTVTVTLSGRVSTTDQ